MVIFFCGEVVSVFLAPQHSTARSGKSGFGGGFVAALVTKHANIALNFSVLIQAQPHHHSHVSGAGANIHHPALLHRHAQPVFLSPGEWRPGGGGRSGLGWGRRFRQGSRDSVFSRGRLRLSHRIWTDTRTQGARRCGARDFFLFWFRGNFGGGRFRCSVFPNLFRRFAGLIRFGGLLQGVGDGGVRIWLRDGFWCNTFHLGGHRLHRRIWNNHSRVSLWRRQLWHRLRRDFWFRRCGIGNLGHIWRNLRLRLNRLDGFRLRHHRIFRSNHLRRRLGFLGRLRQGNLGRSFRRDLALGQRIKLGRRDHRDVHHLHGWRIGVKHPAQQHPAD
mmetsp:Transcript_23347/g.40679  ORF Transcript_23347/g.40679 Transcript_23347/m.40679 type:complete len:331 (-) Transcript_23347:8189-9181(-)